MKYLYDSPSAKPTYRVTEGEKRLDQIPVLKSYLHNKCPERSGGQLHEMDGNHTPSTLNAKLLEKSGGNNGVR
jgi:hypothetical protein